MTQLSLHVGNFRAFFSGSPTSQQAVYLSVIPRGEDPHTAFGTINPPSNYAQTPFQVTQNLLGIKAAALCNWYTLSDNFVPWSMTRAGNHKNNSVLKLKWETLASTRLYYSSFQLLQQSIGNCTGNFIRLWVNKDLKTNIKTSLNHPHTSFHCLKCGNHTDGQPCRGLVTRPVAWSLPQTASGHYHKLPKETLEMASSTT